MTKNRRYCAAWGWSEGYLSEHRNRGNETLMDM